LNILIIEELYVQNIPVLNDEEISAFPGHPIILLTEELK